MISNYQRAGQDDLPQPLDHFILTCHRPRLWRVYPTGWTDAVDDPDRRELLEQLGMIFVGSESQAQHRGGLNHIDPG
jgi:hypothetical protein